MRKRLFAVATAAALVAVGASGSAGSAQSTPRAQAAAKVVAVGDNYFRPRTPVVRVGTSVTWRWRGRRRHNVVFTSGRGRPRGCSTRRGGSCTRRFRRRGTFRYVCTLHGSMTARVTVR